MSFDFNYKFWVATRKDINSLIKRQNVLKNLAPIENPLITLKLFSQLFVLYVELVNKLGYVYSKTFQVQKRAVVRELVEAATRRLLELKNELKNLELSEYVYTDKALIAKKLTPYDLVIWRSPQFLYRRPPEIQNIFYENKIFMNDEEKKEENIKKTNIIKDAVIIIQTHERARKARAYLAAIKYDKKNLKVFKRKAVNYTFSHKPDQPMSIPVKRTIFNANFIKSDESCKYMLDVDNIDTTKSSDDFEAILKERNNAASVIQRAWRAHKNRILYKKRIMQKQTLYGMKTKRRLVKPNQFVDSVVENYKNEIFKQKLDKDLAQLMIDERARLLKIRSPWIMEDISDHIRAWFREFFDKAGAFHPYPDIIKQGTVLLLIEETMTPLEYKEKLKEKGLSKEDKKKMAEKLKLAKKKEKAKKKKERLKEAKRRKKMKAAGIYDIANSLRTNKNIVRIEKAIKQYSIDWRLIDEYLNKNHEAIKEWVTESELAIIHRELRELVDQFMRLEHEMLERALAADNKKKYRKPKVRRPKAKKGKKKKKKSKDLTEDRSLKSLFDELKEAGIIEKYDRKPFSDFIAEFNFIADDFRDLDNLTFLGPAKGDIKMVIQESMLGMGEFTVDKPKSILLVGPVNNGKKLLCNIIASELDAVFMNLSPEKTVQFENDLPYFLHVVMKVARAFQPTILFIQDAHRVFWKRVPKDKEDIKPKLLQKAIMKRILKPIKKDDKIMLLGTSDAPWSGTRMTKVFQKILLVPRSEYGTSFLIWLELMEKNLGNDNVEDYAISALAKVLQNYTAGDVTDNIADTLNVRRKMRLKSAPVQPSEFLEYYFKDEAAPMFPPELKAVEKYDKWFSKSNKLAKLRTKFFNSKKRGKGKKK